MSKVLCSVLLLNSASVLANNDISTRIVGGQDSVQGTWPWIVNIHAGGYVCGGTLIEKNTVLTAAHCLFDGLSQIPASNISAAIGEFDLSSNPSTPRVTISKTYIHQGYNPNNSSSGNDIALLRLTNDHLATIPIQALSLSSTESFVNLQSNVTILGWGSTVGYTPPEVVEASYPNILNEVELPLQTDQQCLSNLGSSYDASTMLCAGQQLGGKDACQGDSGGPLIINNGSSWQQIGIVSWGVGCAAAARPGVYTRLAVYKDWINNFINGVTIDNSLTFYQVTVNESESLIMYISNHANTEAQLTISLNGSSYFSFDETACSVIDANTTCPLTVTYSPLNGSTQQATLTVESDLVGATTVTSRLLGVQNSSVESSSGGGGGSLLFIFSLPLLLLRRYFKK